MKYFHFYKKLIKLNSNSKNSIAKNAFFFQKKKESKINAHLYFLSFSKNVRVGEADTSVEQLNLMLQNGTDFGSYVWKQWCKTNSFKLSFFLSLLKTVLYLRLEWDAKYTYIMFEDWKLLNSLVFEYPIAILVITRTSCSLKVIHVYYTHLILLGLEDFISSYSTIDRCKYWDSPIAKKIYK